MREIARGGKKYAEMVNEQLNKCKSLNFYEVLNKVKWGRFEEVENLLRNISML